MPKNKDNDIVVDTNVFEHMDNPNVRFCDPSKKVIDALLASGTLLCIDEGFDADEAKNKSSIGHEYHDRIRTGTYAFAKLLQFLQGDLVKIISKAKYVKNKKKFEQLIRNKIDRIFLSVALASDSKKFILNDFQDFQKRKRIDLRRNLGVNIVSSEEA